MELTGHRRHTGTSSTGHRQILSPQAATTVSSRQPRSYCSPSGSEGARLSPALGRTGSRPDGLPSPTIPGASTGSASGASTGSSSATGAGGTSPATPALLRQHSAPADWRLKPPSTARPPAASSGFKRPVKQRLSPFGRTPPVTPPRAGELRAGQVAPPAEGGTSAVQVAPPREPGLHQAQRLGRSPAGDGATSSHVQLKQRTSEQRPDCRPAGTRQPEGYGDRYAGVPNSDPSERREHSGEPQRGIAEVMRSMKLKTAGVDDERRSEASFSDGTDLNERQKQRPSAENRSIVTYTDDFPSPPDTFWEKGDENKNYIRQKRIELSVEYKMGFVQSKSEADRYLSRPPLKRGNYSVPEESIVKKSRWSGTWRSPDQSLGCHGSRTFSESFSEGGQHRTAGIRGTGQYPGAYHRSSSYGQSRYDDTGYYRYMGGWPAYSRPGYRESYSYSRFDSPPPGMERGRRRPPLLPTPLTPPTRLYASGSPALVTTTTSMGETPPATGRPLTPPVPQPARSRPGLGWATTMPLLPQLLEPLTPLSPLSPLSVSPLPSPASPLSPPSAVSPSRSLAHSLERPHSPGRDLSPEPRRSRRDRPSKRRARRAVNNDRLCDSDCDSDSADSRVTCRSLSSRTSASRETRDRAECVIERHTGDGQTRLDASHAAERRVGRERGDSSSRPGRRLLEPGDRDRERERTERGRAERRASGAPPAHCDRFPLLQARRSSAGRCQQQCRATGCCDPPAARPASVGRHAGTHRDSRDYCDSRDSRDADAARPERTCERRPRSTSSSDQQRASQAAHETATGGGCGCRVTAAPTCGCGCRVPPPTTCGCGCSQNIDADRPSRRGSRSASRDSRSASREHSRRASRSGSRSASREQTREHSRERSRERSPAPPPAPPPERDLSIFTSEYLSELLQLQRRIMTSRDSGEMAKVLALLWETGQVQDTTLYYDFDLCALDQGVVRQLQKCLS